MAYLINVAQIIPYLKYIPKKSRRRDKVQVLLDISIIYFVNILTISLNIYFDYIHKTLISTHTIISLVIPICSTIFIHWLGHLNRPPISNTIKIGHSLPDFELVDSKGTSVVISDYFISPTIFIFYRGTWCPICSGQIDELAKNYKILNQMGIKIVLISDCSGSDYEKLSVSYGNYFDYLIDKNFSYAKKLKIFHENGTPDLATWTGAPKDTQYPTVVLTRHNGIIIYLDRPKTFYERPDPSVFIKIFERYNTFSDIDNIVHQRTNSLMLKNEDLTVAKIQLAKAVEDMEKTLEEKNALVRILAHDLVNTITVIESSSKFGLRLCEDTNTKTYKLWKNVERAIDTQKKILEHVKEMESITSGKKKIELGPVNIQEVFDESLFIFKEKIESKKLTMEFLNEMGDEKPIVLAHTVSFSNNVLNNLLSNAIKFSFNEGKITIKVYKTSNNTIMMDVMDQGLGMPEDIAKNLFRSDVQTSRSGTNGEEGTGFGMPLVKTFMDKYNGKITLESKPKEQFPQNHGTTFHLEFLKP